MKNSSVWISSILVFTLPSVAVGAGSHGLLNAPEHGRAANYVEGPSEETLDIVNKTAFSLPAGWYAVLPSLPEELKGRVTLGVTTLANYDLDHIQPTELEFTTHSMHHSMIKIDVTTEAADGLTLEEKTRALRVPDANLHYSRLLLSDTIPVKLAGRDGYAYRASTELGDVTIVALDWTPGKTLLASLRMGSSDHLEEALEVLDTVRGGDEPYLPTKTDVRGIAEHLSSLELVASKKLPQNAGECTFWQGSDNGWYAPNSPIGLNLPFSWGTRWISGGSGAYFWGNMTHGNCNNDYFAIDFNGANSSCNGYAGDEGYYIYPAQNGNSYTGYDTYGYGYYVDVQHQVHGIRTRYAHLKQIWVGQGQWVNANTILGTLGSSGNSTGPHLHFGFYQYGYSRCARSGGCPNGEATSWPNSPKPHAMFTHQGWRTMQNGGCYIAPWR